MKINYEAYYTNIALKVKYKLDYIIVFSKLTGRCLKINYLVYFFRGEKMSRIKELRLQKGFTQNKLAELIGADSNLISRWERGKSKPISLYVQKLAQALGTSMDYLLGDTDVMSVVEHDNSLPNEKESSEVSRPQPVRERSVTEKDRALIYEDGGKRFEFPPTPEGYAMFRELINRTIPAAQTITR